MRSTNHFDDRQQLLLDVPALPAAGALAALVVPTGKPTRSASARDQITVELRGLGPRLRARAAQQRMTLSAFMRRAAMALLDDGPVPADRTGFISELRPACASSDVRISMRVSAAHAASLAARVRASDMARGDYVCALLDGALPVPLAADHSSAVQALTTSTDRLAVMSADLNAFSRLLGHVHVEQLEPFRESLGSLVDDVREHLALSAGLIAELKPTRRIRR